MSDAAAAQLIQEEEADKKRATGKGGSSGSSTSKGSANRGSKQRAGHRVLITEEAGLPECSSSEQRQHAELVDNADAGALSVVHASGSCFDEEDSTAATTSGAGAPYTHLDAATPAMAAVAQEAAAVSHPSVPPASRDIAGVTSSLHEGDTQQPGTKPYQFLPCAQLPDAPAAAMSGGRPVGAPTAGAVTSSAEQPAALASLPSHPAIITPVIRPPPTELLRLGAVPASAGWGVAGSSSGDGFKGRPAPTLSAAAQHRDASSSGSNSSSGAAAKLSHPQPQGSHRARRQAGEWQERVFCVVCMDRARDVALLPCAHVVLCEQCCRSIQAASNEVSDGTADKARSCYGCALLLPDFLLLHNVS